MAAAGSINEAKFSLNTPLSTIDPELYGMLRDEKKRQRESIILIASENYVCFSCSVTCLDETMMLNLVQFVLEYFCIYS